jgi:ribose transport system permease protein
MEPKKSGFFREHGRNLGMLFTLGCALVSLGIFSRTYVSFDNLVVVALQMAFIGIACLGATYLIISGNIDLSIGSIFALTAVVAAILAKTFPPSVAMLLAVTLGGMIGLVNGWLVWRVKLSPIIITLGTMAVLRGVVLLLTGGYSVRNVPREFGEFAQTRIIGVPMPVILLLILSVALHYLFTRTTIGRHVFAIGGNREACHSVGIPVRRHVLAAFVINGLIVGLAGVLAAGRFGSASPAFGVSLELDVITAVILGGVAFTGGRGNVLGVLLAVTLLGVISSGIVSLGINPHLTDIIKGAALIIAVVLDQLSQEARGRFQKSLARAER